MAYIKGIDRYEGTMFPEFLDDYIGEDSPTRLIEVFVNSLDFSELGFERSTPEETGRPGYDPRDLLKLLVYGYYYGINSSRRMARSCKINVEVMWLMRKLTPDFRTISDFRKDNITCMKLVFKEFNKFCMKLDLFSKDYVSIDGSKFRAVNAKDQNFTLNKLDDRLKRLDERINKFMEDLEKADSEEDEDPRKLTKEDIEKKLSELTERKTRYESFLKHMEQNGESQISLTDPDSKLMKENDGFGVGYNVQTAIDAGSHMIAGYAVTNAPTDHGQMTSLASEVKKDMGVETIETTCDKGYQDPDDIAAALENGIIPNVIQRDSSSEIDVEYEYSENTVTESQIKSTSPEDIKKCLHNGVIPECLRHVLSDARIEEMILREDVISDAAVTKMSLEEMLEKAQSGYFVRDAERNLVYCPAGEILRQKSIKRNGNIRYSNKLACKRCKDKCTISRFKEVDFNKDSLIKRSKQCKEPCRIDESKKKPNNQFVKKKVVRFKLHMDQKKMSNRLCLSEHPFGTIKRTIGKSYYLLKRMYKVDGETSLLCLAYNMRRAINMCGVGKLAMVMA